MIDYSSDLEACKMLTINAENLTSAISEALHCTISASLRVKKKEEKVSTLIKLIAMDI